MKLIKILIFILSVNLLYSQSIPEPFNSSGVNHNPLFVNKLDISPEASQLLKVNFIPTNLYTGRLNLNIPLFEIEQGELKVPISLSYNSMGIKVEEEVSNVGMGWVLQAGGNMTKMIRDLDDNQLNYIPSKLNPENEWHLTGVGYLRDKSENDFPSKIVTEKSITIDAQPDLFYASVPGLKGKFNFERTSSGNIIANDISKSGSILTTTGYQSFQNSIATRPINQIWFGADKIFPQVNYNDLWGVLNTIANNNIKSFAYDYDEFNIVNSKGVKYKFKTHDVNISSSSHLDGFQLKTHNNTINEPVAYNILRNGYYINKNTWHLDQITDPNDIQNPIVFEYYTFTNNEYIRQNDARYIKGLNFHKRKEDPEISELNLLCNNKPSQSTLGPNEGSTFYYSKNLIYNYVKKINWKGGSVEFVYEKSRDDAPGKNALNEVIVRDSKGNTVKKYQLFYTYHQSAGASFPIHYGKRLKLDRIDLISSEGTTQNRYKFTYYEDIKLPPRNSPQIDFFGYYNQNTAIYGANFQDLAPKLYFVRNRNHHSVTPFPVNNAIEFSGDISLESNTYSTSGLLKTVQNPTRGINEFIYEPNQFDFYGETITGGGVRLQSQLVRDENSHLLRKFDYEYLNETGKSSGAVVNIPKYADIFKIETLYDVIDEPPGNGGGSDESQPGIYHFWFVHYLRSKSNIELTDGGYVGYKQITERESGNGYTKYKYTSPIDFPNIYPETYTIHTIPKNSSFPGGIYVDMDVMRGKLLEKTIYNELGDSLSKEINTYHQVIEEEDPGREFTKGIVSFTSNYSPIYGFLFSTNIHNINYVLSSKTTEEYLPNGIITQTSNILYKEDPIVLVSEKITKDSFDQIIKTNYQYPHDLPTHPHVADLINENRVSSPLVTKYSTNGSPIAIEETVYEKDTSTNNLLLPKYVFTKKGSETLDYTLPSEDLKVTYDQYDTQGNLQQYTLADSTPVSIIWGYNRQYPIAKVEGVPYNVISSQAGALAGLSDNGNLTENSFEALRNTAGALVTCYIYKSLVGVTKIIQPNGQTESYLYDDFGRLEKIIDDQGKELKKIDYHYKD